MGAIFDVPRMELSGIQVFAPADISMHQDVALLATACTKLQNCFNLYPKPIARTSDSQRASLTDWEHGPPPKIIVSDFNFFSKLGKIGLKKMLGGVGFPHWTFFSPGASFSQWTFQYLPSS